MNLSPKEEGLEILKVLDRYFPKRFDGKDSIQWLHKFSTQKRQNEWAAFFFQEYSFPLLTRFLGGWKGPRITNSSRFDFQREYVWDIKLEANTNHRGRDSTWTPLNDIKATRRVIKQESGIGIVIAYADFTFDRNRSLQRWRNHFEERVGRVITRRTRVLKKTGRITDMKTIFISDLADVRRGIREGWLDIFRQGRNSNGNPRAPKYKIRISEVPIDFVTTLNE